MRFRKGLSLMLAATLFVSTAFQSEHVVSAAETAKVVEQMPDAAGTEGETSKGTQEPGVADAFQGLETGEAVGTQKGSETGEAVDTQKGSEVGNMADIPQEPGDANTPQGSETGETTSTSQEPGVTGTLQESGAGKDAGELEKPGEEITTGEQQTPESKVNTPESGAGQETQLSQTEGTPGTEQSRETVETIQDLEEMDESQIPSVMSLLPIKQESASLVLNGYSEEELKAISLKTVLEKLRDYSGNPINISDTDEIVWGYYQNDAGSQIYDEYHKIDRNGTVDLSADRWSKNYTMEILVGNGNQLDYAATRYFIKVYIGNLLGESISYSVYTEASNGGYRQFVREGSVNLEPSSALGDIGIPVTEAVFYVSEKDTSQYKPGDTCYLGIRSWIAADDARKDVKVDVYPLKEALNYYQGSVSDLTGEITDQILNQTNMSSSGGFAGTFTSLDSVNPLDSENAFCLVYMAADTGAVLAYQGLIFTICSEKPFTAMGSLYSYENGQMKPATEPQGVGSSGGNWNVDLSAKPDAGVIEYWTKNISFRLLEGYTRNAEYYYVLETNDQIEKVVLGEYNTRKEAEQKGAQDITAQILPADGTQLPFGYQTSFGKGQWFTIFLKNGTVVPYYVSVSESSTQNYDFVQKKDPWFNVTGAKGYKGKVYIVQNSYNDTYDTLYGCGYQTILINDKSANLADLIPLFTVGENVRAHVGEEQISGQSVQDFSRGPVLYSVFIGENLRNYQVTFVKKESGPKLFVNGPEKREIFLTDYFENRHDILIANVGDADLTGLKVELLDAVHVKLDDYWIVGGAENSTLKAIPDDDVNYLSSGPRENLAKIRLLPDGEGEIKGKLKISADGQEDVYIELTGYASNPKIITEALSESVKYVPYSYVVSTNNMFDWNKVTFALDWGTLPKGVSLDPNTGEIYGVPQETGNFYLRIRADFSRAEFVSSTADFVLRVKDNSNQNVYMATDAGYALKDHVGVEAGAGTYDYVLQDSGDQLFTSEGVLNEFMDLWLNGEKLVEGEDYTKENGSTKITIRSQTFANKANKEGMNTLSAEFRVDGDLTKDLKRAAQNFRLDIQDNGGSGSGSSGDGSGNGSSGGGSGSGSSGSDSFGGDSGGGSSDANTATLVMRLVNGEGNPLAGLTAELHSTPKITKTNQNGIAIFRKVESGSHTLYVKDKRGNLLASKSFELVFGDTVNLTGNQVTVKGGGISTFTVQVSGNEMTFLGVQEGDVYRVVPAQTGDSANPVLWLAMVLVCGAAIAGYYVYRKRRPKAEAGE